MKVIVGVVVSALASAGGFSIRNLIMPEPPPAKDPVAVCEETEQAFREAFEEAQRYGPGVEGPHRGTDLELARQHADVALDAMRGNPACFDRETRFLVETFVLSPKQ